MSATFKIPQTVIRWLGGQVEASLEEQAISKIYGVVNNQQKSAMKSIESAGQASGSAAQGVASRGRG